MNIQLWIPATLDIMFIETTGHLNWLPLIFGGFGIVGQCLPCSVRCHERSSCSSSSSWSSLVRALSAASVLTLDMLPMSPSSSSNNSSSTDNLPPDDCNVLPLTPGDVFDLHCTTTHRCENKPLCVSMGKRGHLPPLEML